MKSIFFNRLLVLLICLFFYEAATSQPYLIGKTTLTFTDPARNNRSIPTDIYYPATQTGTNTTVAGANATVFPIISFGHGFVMTVDAYTNIWNMLVPEGYIVALPKTEGGFSPSHAEFGKDLAYVIQSMYQQNTLNTSIFFNKVAPMNVVMGHSMGGGAAHLAASGSTVIKAIATLAAAETNPSAVSAASNFSIPSLVIAGSNDCVTPPASHQLLMYNATKSSCKTYISITGGSHCYMANDNFNCSFGESSCGPGPSISRSEQHSLIKKYLLPWLNYQLKNNCQDGKNFDAQMREDTKISFQNNCSFCVISHSADLNADKSFRIYPNPFKEKIMFERSASFSNPIEIEIKSMDGKILSRQMLTNNKSIIHTQHLQKGVYILHINNDSERTIRKMIKAE
ncbi:MAG: T9SS type A sorting domain-containing protein [Bacteroidota bacterium]|jgi:predicted dienelactone hydrolase